MPGGRGTGEMQKCAHESEPTEEVFELKSELIYKVY